MEGTGQIAEVNGNRVIVWVVDSVLHDEKECKDDGGSLGGGGGGLERGAL